MPPPMNEVTRLLAAIDAGDRQAADALLPLVYGALRQLAARKLAHETSDQTLDATGLVHEAYLRLVDADRDRPWDGRGHFFAAAAEAMRRILIDNARRKRSQKHGGDRQRENLEGVDIATPEPSEDLLALDEALTRLTARDPVKAELVKLRYFAGLSQPQAAQVLGIAMTTADRYWAYARAWLYREMTRG